MVSGWAQHMRAYRGGIVVASQAKSPLHRSVMVHGADHLEVR